MKIKKLIEKNQVLKLNKEFKQKIFLNRYQLSRR